LSFPLISHLFSFLFRPLFLPLFSAASFSVSVVVVSGVQEVTKHAIYQRTVHNQKAFMNEVIKATKQKPTAEITKLLMVLCAGVFGPCVVEGSLEGEPQGSHNALE